MNRYSQTKANRGVNSRFARIGERISDSQNKIRPRTDEGEEVDKDDGAD